jgi:uncharacterized protein (TIRG00374 family)
LRKRRLLLQLIKIVISAGLLVFLLTKISPERLLPVLQGMNWPYLMIAFSVFFLSALLGSYQWYQLLGAGGIDITFGRTFRLYFVGLFFNNFLPANIGGDAVKIYDVSRIGNDPYQVFAITLLDRVIGITGLCLLAVTGSLILIGKGGIEELPIYLIVFIGCIVPVFALALNRRISGQVKKMFTMITWWGLGERFGSIFEHLGEFRRLRALLGRLTLLALGVQFLRVCTHIAVARALGVAITPDRFLYFFVFIPLLGLLMVLPISINGLGVREGTGVLLFARIGLLEEEALLMEFMTYVVMVTVSLLGGVLFLARHLHREAPRERGEA